MLREFVLPLVAAVGAVSLAQPLAAFDPAQQDDWQALVRHFDRSTATADAAPGFVDQHFDPLPGEVITLMGGSGMEEQAEAGYFESYLQRSFADRRLKVRSIAWSADSVYRQQRPMYFYTAEGDTREGSVTDLRQTIEPGVFVLQFGKMESLDGAAALPVFKASYDALLLELGQLSPRMVLIGPPPFFASGPAAELTEARNAILKQYSGAVRELALVHGAIFVDLASGLDTERADWSRDGVHLSDAGLLEAAGILARGLGLKPEERKLDPRLLRAVDEKNALWQQYLRPTNWAFLFGDRQHVPSSRGRIDNERRWFIEEIQRLPALISEADAKIWGVVAP
jgi:hypothetical protein